MGSYLMKETTGKMVQIDDNNEKVEEKKSVFTLEEALQKMDSYSTPVWDENGEYWFDRFIEKSNREEKIKLLNAFNQCHCCEKHQQGRPTEYRPYVESKSTATQSTQLDCKCQCRHFARWICRSHP